MTPSAIKTNPGVPCQKRSVLEYSTPTNRMGYAYMRAFSSGHLNLLDFKRPKDERTSLCSIGHRYRIAPTRLLLSSQCQPNKVRSSGRCASTLTNRRHLNCTLVWTFGVQQSDAPHFKQMTVEARHWLPRQLSTFASIHTRPMDKFSRVLQLLTVPSYKVVLI